ncbi:UDP-N-acetylmuramate dehydrogenase [Agarivorans aestuarii]|uniref:UDP-N-acetylenolpyruvoylglucosamine reductase n=1 Tax=Agarivorans aestuarii TaxID=1563703 RepID=A0ABU7G5F5_9ALTE|nr:UDP-N-acetylmuramate dehydrogenase [Agarivorans aestuarii]MEE1674462.1 UDP-N-acetylmuramate dehydrogenase [Agarivorans aestuarii]
MSVVSSIQSDVDLSSYNTFGLAAKAKYFAELKHAEDIAELITWACTKKLSWMVIGGGSNLLLLEDFSGLVIVNQIRGIQVAENDECYIIKAAAGEDWHQFVQWTIEQGMPGLENLALIPGTVGASPVQNIGAYGIELADVCSEVEFYSLQTNSMQILSNKQCEFAYRHSIFKAQLKDQVIISKVTFKLSKSWAAKREYGGLKLLAEDVSAQAVFDEVCKMRISKLPDPKHLGNAGSFFKNPLVSQEHLSSLLSRYPEMPNYQADKGQAKLAAGWLIDKLGLKGFSIGGAAVHQDQALVLVNKANAQAEDFLALCRHIRQQVWQTFDVLLEPEVRFIKDTGEIEPNAVLGKPNEAE